MSPKPKGAHCDQPDRLQCRVGELSSDHHSRRPRRSIAVARHNCTFGGSDAGGRLDVAISLRPPSSTTSIHT
jgi:hypothetical protein